MLLSYVSLFKNLQLVNKSLNLILWIFFYKIGIYTYDINVIQLTSSVLNNIADTGYFILFVLK